MNQTFTRKAIPAVPGKTISSAFVMSESPDAHGVCWCLQTAQKLSVNFEYETRVGAEILLYRWDEGEAAMLDQTTAL